jgi:hypothetical protein
MSANATETQVVVPAKKTKKYLSRPARKQVKPGEVEKKETPQTGKEYSMQSTFSLVPVIAKTDMFFRYLVQQVGWRRQRG